MENRRRVLANGEEDFSTKLVDMGTGVLWATGNLIKRSDGTYGICDDPINNVGSYFSWGDIHGHHTEQERDGYSHNSSNYSYTHGNGLNHDMNGDPYYDAAAFHLGEGWRIPTKAEYDALLSACSRTRISGGVYGEYYQLVNRNDSSKVLYFPCGGYYSGTTLYNNPPQGYYWTSTYRTGQDAYAFGGNTTFSSTGTNRPKGYLLRPIYIELPDFVDLSLPSGKKWCKKSLRAASEEQYGFFYAWGSLVPNSWDGYYTGNTSPLPSDKDIITQTYGSGYRMPTDTEVQELIDNTNYSWATINGVSGGKFTSKVDSSKYIFFPATGYYYNGNYEAEGGEVALWTSTVYNRNENKALYLTIENGKSPSVAHVKMSCGFNVRAIKE